MLASSFAASFAATRAWAAAFAPGLVALALVICAVGSYAAMALLGRAVAAPGRRRHLWLAAGALAFGADVWSTHFIAMLAFRPGMAIAYRFWPTALSIAIAVLGAVPPFALIAARPGRLTTALVAGPAIGLTIAAMHFTGMSAMAGPAALLYDRRFVAAALLVVVTMGVLAVGLGGALRRPRESLLATSFIVLAIAGLHFTAMGGLTIVMPIICALPSSGLGHGLPALPPPPVGLGETNAWLAAAVAGISGVILLLGLGSTIAARRMALAREAEARRLRALVESTTEGLLILEGGVVLLANDALAALLGETRGAVLGRSLLDLVAPDCHAALLGWLSRSQEAGARTEIVARGHSGERVAVEIASHPGEWEGRPVSIVAFRDISAIREAEERLNYLAHHDGLTGLVNRRTLQERLEHAISQPAPGGECALLYIDLDGFKSVNDLYGHGAGDGVLTAVAGRLRGLVRATDTVARLGGDEFVILQCRAGDAGQPGSATLLARRLIERLDEPFKIDGQTLTIGASIGIALHPADGTSAETLIHSADIALYQAKHAGRGTFRFFEPEMDRLLKERRDLERDLRLAVTAHQIALHYQPIFDGADKRLAGFEALMRWTHPVRGPIPPAAFIPLAEETGIIIPLGLWVLETACAEAVTWPQPCLVAVNLSPAQFRHPDLTRAVHAILVRTGLSPDRLELEVTEGFLIERPEQALATLLSLRALGVSIALDDFGTGYSSLSYLQRFPFDRIKIDRSFVRDLEGDKDAAAIVRAIVGLGHSLRMDVTAEGVETASQLSLLRLEGCDQIQGFLLGRPMPPEQARALLRDHLLNPAPAAPAPEAASASRPARLANAAARAD